MARTLSANTILQKKFKTILLSNELVSCIGEIEKRGVVFIWGNSGNGKTSFILQLIKSLCVDAGLKVLFYSKEEGAGYTMQKKIRSYGLAECGSRFQLDDRMTFEELDERLSLKRSCDVCIIDSLQYAQINFNRYKAFKGKHRNKLLVFISQADGKQPYKSVAKSVMYDADLKIWVEGYKAFSKGRSIGDTGEYTIWEEGAKKYWGGKYLIISNYDKEKILRKAIRNSKGKGNRPDTAQRDTGEPVY